VNIVPTPITSLSMSDCSSADIRSAYEEVRADSNPVNWMLISYAEGTDNVWALIGKGEGGLDELKEKLSPSFRGFGYLRVISGDELSKRAKFVLINFCGSAIRQVQRVKMTVHGADVKKVLEHYAVQVDVDTPEDLTMEDIMERVRKAGGANYNNAK